MNIVLFSGSGIHYEGGAKGDVTAVYTPVQEKVRHFADIPSISTKTVKERYGDLDHMPLWRQERDEAVVYGAMNSELMELRNGVEVFLPQDFVPEDSNAFYFAFGDRWVVHGMRTTSEDGRQTWGISRIDGKGTGVVESIVSSVSDRMLEGGDDNICIAVHGEGSIFRSMQKSIKPLGLKVVRFDTLEPSKAAKPLYKHRDHSIFMLTAAMFSVLLLAAAAAYLTFGMLKLENLQTDITATKEEIRSVQMNRPLGHIRNPQEVLDIMSKALPRLPSALIDAAANVSVEFGTLKTIRFGEQVETTLRGGRAEGAMQSDYVHVITELSDVENPMLIDQEELARSVIRTRPWIHELESIPGNSGTSTLLIYLQAE